MASILDKIKQKRGNTAIKNLQEQLDKQEGAGGGYHDERIYRPKLDKQKGSNSITIRFLPPKDDGCPDYVELKEMQFDGKNGKYWQKSLATLIDEETGKPRSDPALEARINAYVKRKETGDQSYGDIGKAIREVKKYYYNVLVIKDDLQPEAVGKVKILQVGPMLAKIVEEAFKPEFDNVEPIDPFDPFDGHDFFINVASKQVGADIMPDYTKSAFAVRPSSIGSDEEIEALVMQTYDLREFIDPATFKSRAELEAEFLRCYGKPYNWLSKNYTESVASSIDQRQHQPKQAEPEPQKEETPPWDAGEEAPSVPDQNADKMNEIRARIAAQRAAKEQQ